MKRYMYTIGNIVYTRVILKEMKKKKHTNTYIFTLVCIYEKGLHIDVCYSRYSVFMKWCQVMMLYDNMKCKDTILYFHSILHSWNSTM